MASPAALPDQSITAALGRSEPWAGLMRRLRDSQARLAVAAPLLPAGLRPGVRPGPLDDAAWVLLVDHAAAAAKLRQLLPLLHESLVAAGWPALEIKVRISPRVKLGT